MSVKVNAYPTRTFQGEVTRVGASLHEDGGERFVIAESRLGNADGMLKAGMLGRAKVAVARRSLLWALARRPARYLWTKL